MGISSSLAFALFLVLAAFGTIVPVHLVLLFRQDFASLLCTPPQRVCCRLLLRQSTSGCRLCDCLRHRPMAARESSSIREINVVHHNGEPARRHVDNLFVFRGRLLREINCFSTLDTASPRLLTISS